MKMTLTEYNAAVEKIHNAVRDIPDEQVQEVWDAMTDLLADFEQAVMEDLGVED